jgi:hypothetical protein
MSFVQDGTIYLGEGDKPLVSDVTVQLIWLPGSTSLEFALEAACIDQEAMVGYPLKLKSWRETQTGGDRREVFATFEPRT